MWPRLISRGMAIFNREILRPNAGFNVAAPFQARNAPIGESLPLSASCASMWPHLSGAECSRWQVGARID